MNGDPLGIILVLAGLSLFWFLVGFALGWFVS